MRDRTKPRGILSTVLISFFLTSFAGLLWVGRGWIALIAALAMVTLVALGIYLEGFGVLFDETSITGLGGAQYGAWIDYGLIGIIHVVIVLPFRRNAKPLKWYSNGLSVISLAVVLPSLMAAVVRTFLIQPFSIPAGSMVPALEVGDHLFVSKYAYGYSRYSAPFGLLPIDGRIFLAEPMRGDIVVFKYPPNPSVDYVKRLVGLPGESVQMIDGVLHIDNRAVGIQRGVGSRKLSGLEQDAEVQIESLPNGVSYEILNISDGTPGDDTRKYVVPAGHYFVLGDNRDNSTDSRFNVGFVPFDHFVGRAERIYWNSQGLDFADRADVRPDQ